MDIPAGTPQEEALARVRAVQEAADVVLLDGAVYATATADGEVRIREVTTGEEGPASWVDIQLAGETQGGDPHFRIFNPPLLVQDPMGSVEINGVRHREDPMQSIAEVVASLGGAQTPKQRIR